MDRYLYKKLLGWKAQKERKPLIINGVRQVGKTYLLQHFGKHEFNHSHYVNFEEDSRLSRLFALDLNPHALLMNWNSTSITRLISGKIYSYLTKFKPVLKP